MKMMYHHEIFFLELGGSTYYRVAPTTMLELTFFKISLEVGLSPLARHGRMLSDSGQLGFEICLKAACRNISIGRMSSYNVRTVSRDFSQKDYLSRGFS